MSRPTDSPSTTTTTQEAPTMTTPTPLATFNVYDHEAADVPPAGVPVSAWPHIMSAAVTGKATGSLGARTSDPATGREYRVTFRRTVSDDEWRIESTTPVADVFDVTPKPLTETDVEHTFQPLVTMRRRPDGRWDTTIDWSDSYLHATDVRPGSAHWPITDADAPGTEAASAAIDAWAKRSVLTCIVPAVDWQGITRVECVGCATVVTEPTAIELWNGYGAGPCGCPSETTASRWTFVDGTVRTILDGNDVEHANH